MPLRLNVEEMVQMPAACDAFRNAGKLRSARGLLRASVPGFVGESCAVHLPDGRPLTAEIVGFDDVESQLMCFDGTDGLQPGLEIVGLGKRRSIPVGAPLLGRVIDGIGRPADGQGPLNVRRWRHETALAPDPLMRQRITDPLVTGQRVIDGLLTIGRGQRVGLFAGSGVGKSTLMGEIAKGAESDVNVIALVGERGREVRPFIEDCLGPRGMEHSVVVVATSDETPLMRIKSVLTAVTVAEAFRDEGAHVLFFLDSLTRLAMAQRELGLLLGEPPGARGYPPSVQRILAEVLERLGCGDTGAITGLITVLVEGDDMDEPVADTARSILDGHIVLDRTLAAEGHFPAVNVAASISRLFHDITNDQQKHGARCLRSIMATWEANRDLIQIGAYKTGTSPQVDRAVQLMPAVRRFLQQKINERSGLDECLQQLQALTGAWPYTD